jgi:cell division septation protein DedD
VRDAQELVSIAKSFEEDLEKDDRFVLSLSSLKKLDDIEKLTKRIRGRLKKF